MLSPHKGSLRRSDRRRWALLAGVASFGLLTGTGCQVEYAGMTLPSGKFMHDDVQYFAKSPDFPYANTQAATQRARMSAMGMNPGPVGGAGALADPNAVNNPMLGPRAMPVPVIPSQDGNNGPGLPTGVINPPAPAPGTAPPAATPPGTVPAPM